MQLNQSLMTSVGQVPMSCSGPGIRLPRADEEPAATIWWTQLHWSRTGAVVCLFSIHIPHTVCETWCLEMECVILFELAFGFLHNKAAKNKQWAVLLNVYWMLSLLKIVLYACIMFHKGKKKKKAFLKTFFTLSVALFIANVRMRYCT